MKKYLTFQNITILILSICVAVLLFVVINQQNQINGNYESIKKVVQNNAELQMKLRDRGVIE